MFPKKRSRNSEELSRFESCKKLFVRLDGGKIQWGTMDGLQGGLCGVHLPVVIEVKRTCHSPGVSKIMKQINSRRSHWTYTIVHPDHPWSSVVRYQFVWTWKQSGRHCSSCCNPSSRNTSSQISTLGKKQSRLGIGFSPKIHLPQGSMATFVYILRPKCGRFSWDLLSFISTFAAEKVDPKRGGPWRVGIWARWDGFGSCREISIARKPREFWFQEYSARTWVEKVGH